MKQHAFVAMPYGTKPGPDGRVIDFNRVYGDLIKPALESAGLETFRADDEVRAGDIRADMLQELLLADLVVADLTLDNTNVWYELGVRHALRARGVVLICGGAVTTAFDLYTDRRLRYGLRDGKPDPATLDKDRGALAEMARATMESWRGRLASPVYHLMPNLREPDWRSLRIEDVREFWEQHDAWERRVDLGRKAGRVGDVLILADEAPVAAFRAEAWIEAGEALRRAGSYGFALEQLERGLEIQPGHLQGRRELGMCLQRLAAAGWPGHSLDRAREHYQGILKDHPGDSETWALLGRVDKDAWTEAWRQPGRTPQELRDGAAYEVALLRAAIESYRTGYRHSPGHYHSGINALTLMHVHRHLTGDGRYDSEIARLPGAVRFAAECQADEGPVYWARATLGELEVLVGTASSVAAAYTEAIARNDRDWFALESSRAQLLLLKDLGFRPETVDAGLASFDTALQKRTRPGDRWRPRRVLLFSGHMVDAPDRPTPRFPSSKVPVAAQKIGAVLDQLGAGPEDLALTEGACGGDILFTEACRRRGVKVNWLQPYREPQFMQTSVLCGGPSWRHRYLSAKAGLAAPPRNAPDELGEPPGNVGESYPYERCNLWLLYTALAWGVDKVCFICLWDGAAGDGGGGTARMLSEVKRRMGRVHWIDSRLL